ncbi:unnamed protein product [Clonostachys solani]|uniref:Peptidase M20 domain-containing protein 2 n=1 Tax=Clonostachys solani TaxID=160281 RepID=A0A9N9ZK46_9HYPO|nr:unnamed protein product [Clonostachys solani]
MTMKNTLHISLLALSMAGIATCQNNTNGLAQKIFAAIDSRNDQLKTVNQEIWANPETAMEEVHAHEILTNFLEDQGFTVTRSAFNLSTAFKATYSSGEGRSVSFNAEYDALPGIGHACGHNLIATSGVAAAIGVKEALEHQGVSGSVVVLGTPAEESIGGKIKMLDAGAYENLDCSLMAHPGNNAYGAWSRTLASWRANVTWTGKASHAALAPWQGQNALDGFVAAYQMTGLYRQQLMATDRIHHIIKNTDNLITNVIPDRVESEWGVRGTNRARQAAVIEQLNSIVNGSASGTNTTVFLTKVQDYWDQNPSFQLAKTYYDNLIEYFDPSKDESTSKFSISTPEEEYEAGGSPSASSDQGNVSWFLPSIQVGFPIGGSAPNHNSGFTKVAGTDFAFDQAITTSKVLALTALEVLQNATFAAAMKKEWEEMIAELQF